MEDGSGQRRARRRNMRDEGGRKLNGGGTRSSSIAIKTIEIILNCLIN